MQAMTDKPRIPDDLVTVTEAARELGMKYPALDYHVRRQGFARWVKKGARLVSLSEVRAYMAEYNEVRPVEDAGDGSQEVYNGPTEDEGTED